MIAKILGGFGLNPWVLLGCVVAFVTWSAFVGVKGYNMGADRGRLNCEDRVQKLQADWQEKYDAVEALNRQWQERITSLQNDYERIAEERSKLIAGLNEKVREYEATLDANSTCRLDRSDVDRLR